jgi:hypothetical protein
MHTRTRGAGWCARLDRELQRDGRMWRSLTAPDQQGADDAAEAWDAAAQMYVGLMIGRYLAEKPPPDSSRIAGSLAEWGSNLLRDGRARLEGAADGLSRAEALRREAREAVWGWLGERPE